MSPLINWDEALPSDASDVRADVIRALWAALSAGLNESLEWDGPVAGQLRAGAAPSYVTTEANIPGLMLSNASDTGRLAFASDTSRLWMLGLAPTNTRKAYFVGGPQLIEHIDQVQRGVAWYIGSGTSLLVTPDGNSTITFNNDGLNSSRAIVYETPPQVVVTSDDPDYMPLLTNVTGVNFVVGMRPIQSAAANVTITWTSSGTSTI